MMLSTFHFPFQWQSCSSNETCEFVLEYARVYQASHAHGPRRPFWHRPPRIFIRKTENILSLSFHYFPVFLSTMGISLVDHQSRTQGATPTIHPLHRSRNLLKNACMMGTHESSRHVIYRVVMPVFTADRLSAVTSRVAVPGWPGLPRRMT